MRYFHMFEDVLVSQMAWKIIAVSESTKKDFVRTWKMSEKRVRVIHHGFTPQSAESAQSLEKSLVQLPERFLFFFSTLQPRKNLEGLIAAFRQYKNSHPEDGHKLVVAGRVGWRSEGILETIECNRDIVLYLNHVSDADRTVLYSKATALCVPSLYEGFGMWILEAFDAGVPVITSNISSMPEVGGNAAEYCDPHSLESIKKAMERVLLDPRHRENLVRLGKERLKKFSWRICATQTLAELRGP
jgi:glycosyltransferase involved in cell wall biosynthesis